MIGAPSPALISVLLFAAAAAFTYRSRKSPMRCKSTFTCDLPLSLFVKDSHAEIHTAAHIPVSQPMNGFSAMCGIGLLLTHVQRPQWLF